MWVGVHRSQREALPDETKVKPMSKIRNIASEFARSKGCATQLGAQRRIDRIESLMGDDADKYGFIYTIIARPDGSFLPVAILGDDNRHLALFLANRGIAVLKA